MARLSSRHRNVSRVLLGAHIKQARKEAGLSQTEVGKLLSKALRRPEIFSQAAISDFERGVTIFPEQDLPVLAQVLGKPVEYFTNLPDDKLMEKGQKLFDVFKRANRLPVDWPALRQLSDEELYTGRNYYNRTGFDSQWAKQIELILDQARRPSQMVLTAPGHGCSTLSRWIAARLANKAIRWGLIPARIALEDLPEFDPEAKAYYEHQIRLQIVEVFLRFAWGPRLPTENRDILLGENPREILMQMSLATLSELVVAADARLVLVIDYSSPLVRENFNRYLIALGQFRQAIDEIGKTLDQGSISHMNFANTRIADTLRSFEQRPGEIVVTSQPSFRDYDLFDVLALHTFGGPLYKATAELDKILQRSSLNGLGKPDLPVAIAMEELKNRLILAAGS